jgi:glycolate dehydrogenase FAD-binding subunit
MRPASIAEAVEILTAQGESGTAVCPSGAGTRLLWGAGVPGGSTVDTGALDRIVRHDAGDFTAELEAGVPLSVAQQAFAPAGQWLALDPPGDGTIGGLVATGDSGPALHRYGGVRDLVIGMTVVLSDGTVARSGGNVIKNVAGYDLGKLFTGSYGTLGLIATVTVRLHPLPTGTATAIGETADPAALGAAAVTLSRRPLELLSFDASWSGGRGRLAARFAGRTAVEQATAAAGLLGSLESVTTDTDDGPLWTSLAAAQRSPDGAVLSVSGLPTDLPRLCRAADQVGASLVSRAGLGRSWLVLPPGDDLPGRVATLRQQAGRPVTVLDGADRVLPAPSTVDGAGDGRGWPVADPGALQVMRRVKARFDPARIFRPGCYVGGI